MKKTILVTSNRLEYGVHKKVEMYSEVVTLREFLEKEKIVEDIVEFNEITGDVVLSIALEKKLEYLEKESKVIRVNSFENYEVMIEFNKKFNHIKINDNKNIYSFNYNDKEILDLNVPVISFSSTVEGLGKQKLIRSIVDVLKSQGFRVSIVSDCNNFGFQNFETLPGMNYYNKWGHEKSILYINRLFKKIERDQNPDLILLSVPGKLFPLNSMIYDDFGYSGWLLQNAISIDSNIHILPNNSLNDEYLSSLSPLLKYRYGLLTNSYIISDVVLDVSENRYRAVQVEKHRENNNSNVYNINDDNLSEILVGNIVRELSVPIDDLQLL